MPEDSTLNHWNIDTTKSDETPKGMGSWGLRTSTLKFNKALRRNWNDAIKKFGANHDSWDSLTRDEKDWFNLLVKQLSKSGDNRKKLLDPHMGMTSGGRFAAAIPSLGASELLNEPNEDVGIQYGCQLQTIFKACEEHKPGGIPFAENVALLGSVAVAGDDVPDLGGGLRNSGKRMQSTVHRILDKKNKLFFKYSTLSNNIPKSLREIPSAV